MRFLLKADPLELGVLEQTFLLLLPHHSQRRRRAPRGGAYKGVTVAVAVALAVAPAVRAGPVPLDPFKVYKKKRIVIH